MVKKQRPLFEFWEARIMHLLMLFNFEEKKDF